ncbi:hypothetical protein [Actinomadura rudentiformis]|uniref:Uncharacterized protein n=1 Tax=Actinomadura rudentiformis TaxID=359158 RepID=A0A6H9YK98_9ACTN|nr:hypothetical protein [Actinomadura rudentiformis]KAB2341523.1 hypothetical protein F8566_40990 [Actinomadura rudentiformis]
MTRERQDHSPTGSSPALGLRIRLMGLPEEVSAGAHALAEVFDVVEVSSAYPCRGASQNVRAYLQVRFKSSQT